MNRISRLISLILPSFLLSRDRDKAVLRGLRKELKENVFYNVVSDKFQKPFAEFIVSFFGSLDYLSEYFESAEYNSQEEEYEFDRHYVGAFLASQSVTPSDLNYEDLASEMEGSNIVYRIDPLLSKNLRKLDKEEIRKWDDCFADIIKLQFLSQYSQDSILMHWNVYQNQKRISAQVLMQPLLDLYYLIQDLRLGAVHREILEEMNPENFYDEKFTTLNTLLNILLNDSFLEKLLQIISHDPHIELREIEESSRPVSSYLKSQIVRNKACRQKIIASEEQALVNKSIANLLEGDPLLPVEFYDREISHQLLSRGFPELKYVIPLELIYNFDKKFNNELFSPFFKDLQLAVDFASEAASKDFHLCLDHLEKTARDLKKFRTDMNSSGYSSMIPVIKALQEPFISGSDKSALIKNVNETNAWVDRICRDSFKGYRVIAGFLRELSESLEGNRSEIIFNGFLLKSSNHGLYTRLNEINNIFNKMVHLLNRFVSPVDDIKKGELQEPS